MPNANNITAPATLIAYGRSGTSLLQAVFDEHPDYGITGETSNLIHSVYYGLEAGKGIVRGPSRNFTSLWGALAPTYEDRCAHATRAAFLSMFDDDKRHWMQKPIAHALCREAMQRRGMKPDDYFAWYWQVISKVFPAAKCFTVLRNPCDVILSGRKYWGLGDATIWNGIEAVASCILHPDSKVGHAILYEDLVRDPEPVLRALFNYLGTDYHPGVLKAFEKIWVPRGGVWHEGAPKHKERTEAAFSRQADWGSLDLDAAQPSQIEAIRRSWERFGHQLELPVGLGG